MFQYIEPEVYLLSEPLHMNLQKATRLKINYVYCINQLLRLFSALEPLCLRARRCASKARGSWHKGEQSGNIKKACDRPWKGSRRRFAEPARRLP